MSADKFVVENIHVAAPCPADWNKMAGDGRIRHCCECNLNVYNISEMTRTEAEQLIREHEGRLCVRFYRRLDGTILTRNCPQGLRTAMRRLSRIGVTVLAAAASVGSAFSQKAGKNENAVQTQGTQSGTGLDLTVVDQDGAVVPGAKVVLCHCKNHGTRGMNTDATGTAHFTGLNPGTYSVLVDATGFKTSRQNVKLQRTKLSRLQVKMQIAPVSVTVEVASNGPVHEMGTVGMVTMTENPPIWPVAGGSRGPAPLRR